MKLKTTIVTFFLFFTLFGCGYKPSTYYAKQVLGDNIFVKVNINASTPENSVLIKDAINEAVYNRFKSKLTNKANADTFITLSLGSVSLSTLSYDEKGYAVLYKNVVNINFNVKDKFHKTHSISSSGEYSFAIETQGVISEQKKFDAIKIASIKAIDKFIAQMAYIGYKNEN